MRGFPFGASWGEAQRVSGPVILIPIADEKKEAFVVVMPEALDVHVSSSHEFRRRGIFDVPVFEMEVTGLRFHLVQYGITIGALALF